MSFTLIGFLGILLMFLLMALGIPIALSISLAAICGILYLKGPTVLASAVDSILWHTVNSYTLSVLPLFVLMGYLLMTAGVGSQLFDTFRKWFGNLKGGLGISTVVTSGLFAAACASSVASTSTMSTIAFKEMKKGGFTDLLSSGSIIAGGTLGILIPPSTAFIIYGMMTEQSVGKLLIAGILPGAILVLLFILTIMTFIIFKPEHGPPSEKFSLKEKLQSLNSIIWIIILFVVIIGGMYEGLFTPTEAAAVGAAGALIITAVRRKLTFSNLVSCLADTIKTTGFVFAIIIGAFLFNYFLVITKLPSALSDFFVSVNLSPIGVILLIILMYIILGAVMDSLAMLVITVPLILPTLTSMNIDLIWFGVLVVILQELALISPPFGMNIFILKGVIPEVPIGKAYKGAFLFSIPIFILILLLIAFPSIATILPDLMS